MLEDVQRRAAQFTKGNYQSAANMTHMFKELGWQAQFKRKHLQRALMFREGKVHVAITLRDIWLESAVSRTRAKHCHKLRTRNAATSAQKSFCIQDWNCLPAARVEAKSPSALNAALSR